MAQEEAVKQVPLGRSVREKVERLREMMTHLGCTPRDVLPQIAVVGSQGSGKSSLLGALIGRDFIPTSEPTRCPLIVQLVRTDGSEGEFAIFPHLPGKRFYDLDLIRDVIKAETQREAGRNKGFSDKEIRVNFFSPSVVDITLVDLPGIAKVPAGDQLSDIEYRIRKIIMSYIKLSSCLILAMTQANADLANSDALQIAGLVDPDGYRTIGVITKLDIIDGGTNARNILLGEVVPLRLGYVGVKNQSRKDITCNRAIKDELIDEEEFFHSCSLYEDVADRCGVTQLAKKLDQILLQRIKLAVPELKRRVVCVIRAISQEITECEGLDEMELKRKCARETLHVLGEVYRALEQGFDAEVAVRKTHGSPTSPLYSTESQNVCPTAVI